MRYYQFVKWDPAPLETVLLETIPRAIQEYDAGNKKPFHDLGIATTNPEHRRGGWCFDLRPYLRRFWVKTKYYGIMEYYAVNKSAIRKELKSHVIKIVEI